MPALSLSTASHFAANDIEDAVMAAELDWLEQVLRDAQFSGVLTDASAFNRFDAAWARLERMAVALGMPENGADDAASWAGDYLRQHGRVVHQPVALTIGTPEYRQRHIAMLWRANLWHEAIMILSGVSAIGLLFYAIAKDIATWM